MFEACTVEAAKAVQATLRLRDDEPEPEPENEPEPEHEAQPPGPPEGVPPTAASGVQDWGDQQVAAWLRDVLKFEDVAQVVTAHGVDGATATEMIRDDWVELGVSGFKAAKIVGQLKKLV